MTASEFAFMALGLVLGGASGAALVFVIGSRPPAPREIRLTVGQDAIPRRVPATLSADGFATATTEPARGGPADRRSVDRPGHPDTTEAEATATATVEPVTAPAEPAAAAAPAVPVSTPAVLVTSSRVGIPIHREADPAMAAIQAARSIATPVGADREVSQPALVGRPRDPQDSAPFSVAPLTAAAVLDRQPRVDRGPTSGRATEHSGESSNVASSDVGVGAAHASGGAGGAGSASMPVRAGIDATGGGTAGSANTPARTTSEPDEPCSAAEAIADERCRQADVARLGAERAAEATAATQRDYDALREQAERARSSSDPRALQELKETARQAFRSDRRAALDRAGIDMAARTWLTTINQLNGTARDATSALARAETAAVGLLPTLERLAAESDAARVASDAAATACREATATLAACREAAAGDRRAAETLERLASAEVAPNPTAPAEEPDLLEHGGGTPVVVRIVQGDRDARSRVAAALLREYGEPDRPWADLLSEFADGVRMRAIEESLVDLPAEHPFWGQFAGDETREVVRALSALGYRYDGLGGWLDEHVPNQRDLSRAVGYAGQDSMRVRHWPAESEMADLLSDVYVAADEYLGQAGGDLSLGEVVDMLGARADSLTTLWDAWETAQPLLRAPADEPPSG